MNQKWFYICLDSFFYFTIYFDIGCKIYYGFSVAVYRYIGSTKYTTQEYSQTQINSKKLRQKCGVFSISHGY